MAFFLLSFFLFVCCCFFDFLLYHNNAIKGPVPSRPRRGNTKKNNLSKWISALWARTLCSFECFSMIWAQVFLSINSCVSITTISLILVLLFSITCLFLFARFKITHVSLSQWNISDLTNKHLTKMRIALHYLERQLHHGFRHNSSNNSIIKLIS